MANEQNLKFFTSNQDREEASKNGKKGGKASGVVRRRKANMRKMAQAVLDGKYWDKVEKRYATGEELIQAALAANAIDPDSKNWGKAMDLLVMLTEAHLSTDQKARQKAETQFAKARAKAADPTQATSTFKDNFIEVLDSTAKIDWSDESDETDEDDDV